MFEPAFFVTIKDLVNCAQNETYIETCIEEINVSLTSGRTDTRGKFRHVKLDSYEEVKVQRFTRNIYLTVNYKSVGKYIRCTVRECTNYYC